MINSTSNHNSSSKKLSKRSSLDSNSSTTKIIKKIDVVEKLTPKNNSPQDIGGRESSDHTISNTEISKGELFETTRKINQIITTTEDERMPWDNYGIKTTCNSLIQSEYLCGKNHYLDHDVTIESNNSLEEGGPDCDETTKSDSTWEESELYDVLEEDNLLNDREYPFQSLTSRALQQKNILNAITQIEVKKGMKDINATTPKKKQRALNSFLHGVRK